MFQIKTLISQFHRLFQALILIGIISSCTTHTVTETPYKIESTPSIVPTALASSTPTPIVEKIFFSYSDQSPSAISQSISITLVELAQAEGWEVIISNERPFQEFEPGTRVVVVMPPDPGLTTISNEHPDIQFLSIGISGLQASSNLNVLGPDGFPDDQIAFIAGYISSVISKDWRSGLINQGPSEWIDAINRSFSNGMIYYCGLCQLTYPPFYNYPIMVTIPEQATDLAWEDAADSLLSQAVETVFIYSYEVNHVVLESLSRNDVTIWGMVPPPTDADHLWAATLRFAPEQIIRDRWEDVVNGNSGWTEDIPIVLDDVNETRFSVGKQRWVQEIIDDVVRGYIGTGASIDFNSP